METKRSRQDREVHWKICDAKIWIEPKKKRSSLSMARWKISNMKCVNLCFTWLWGGYVKVLDTLPDKKPWAKRFLGDFHNSVTLLLKTKKKPFKFRQCRFYAYSHWLSVTHALKLSFHRAKCRSGREMLPPPWWCIHWCETSQKQTVFWWLYQAAPGTLWWIVGTDETRCLFFFYECGKKKIPCRKAWGLSALNVQTQGGRHAAAACRCALA